MSEASELLNGNDISAYTAEPETEGRIIVGNDRFITVPEGLKRIAVQNDHDVETVTFECPRYWDNHDMSEMDVYVQYLRPDGVLGRYLCEDVWIDETDDTKMLFNWTVSGHVTPEDGKLTVQVCVQKESEAGTDLNHWNSELNEDLYISKGLDCGGAYTSNSPSQVKQITITESPFMTHVEADEGYQLKTVQIMVDIPEQEPVAPDPTKPIRFYDYDGTLLYSYTHEEIAAMDELPKPDGDYYDHEPNGGLYWSGWNYLLDDIKAAKGPVNVGAMYITDDFATRLYVSVRDTTKLWLTDISVTIGLKFGFTIADDTTIDWGDGSDPVLVTTDTAIISSGTGVEIEHTYTTAGDYVISITNDQGKITLSHPGFTCGIMGNVTTIRALLRKVEIGPNVAGISEHAFTDCVSLSSVIMSNSGNSSEPTTIGYGAFRLCRSLKHLNLPMFTGSIAADAFGYSGIRSIAMPPYLTNINSTAFDYCTALNELVVPDSVTTFAVSECENISRIVMPASYADQISTGTFEGDGLHEFDFSSFTTVPVMNSDAFSGCNQGGLIIKVPADLYDEWVTNYAWPSIKSCIVAV